MTVGEKPQTFLGFDFGTTFIGTAVGQTVTHTAKPLMTIKVRKNTFPWNEIDQLIKEWKPNALIVGLPLNMDGSSQQTTELAILFSEQLAERSHLPVHTMDERLTTREAKARLFEAGGYRALEKTSVDAIAAQIILEAWMAFHRKKSRQNNITH